MRIGLLSDTHDALDRTQAALEILEARGADVLIHAGDLTSGRLVPVLDGWTVWLARGNGDWPEAIEEAIDASGVDVRYAEEHALELSGKRIGVIHGDYDGRLETMITSGRHDLVVHGHSHAFRDERVDGTRVVNPGAVWRAQPATVCVYDTEADDLERINLD